MLAAGALLIFHWGILLEVADGYSRLARRTRGMELLDRFEQEEGYHLRVITESLLSQALHLYRCRPDKEWGLTDCISFALMQAENITEALTADIHFRQGGFSALLLEK